MSVKQQISSWEQEDKKYISNIFSTHSPSWIYKSSKDCSKETTVTL